MSPCLSPGQAWPGKINKKTGKRPNSSRPTAFGDKRTIPCGRCVGCRRDEALSWSVRVWHEQQSHEQSCILTLTYHPDKDPGELSIEVMQKFTDLLRHRKGVPPFRYFLSGEYMQSGSPHYHVCVLGYRPDDCYYWKLSPSGDKLYRSPFLETIWTEGFALIGTLDFKSAAYCAGYVLKKIFAPAHADGRQIEFRLMSTRPAIGKTWFEKNYRETLRDQVALPNGGTIPLPRFYLDLLERIDLDAANTIRRARSRPSVPSDIIHKKEFKYPERLRELYYTSKSKNRGTK